jgi:putative hydrolase of the HAD superfamily
MTRLPPTIRAVFFDAVGTLRHPDPPAADLYATAGARFGSRLPRAVITKRFGAAFRRQEEADRASGHVTSEEREVARWRGIVAEVLDDVTDVDRCFSELYDHFARPDAWRVEPDADAMLHALAEHGIVLGVCSNFDHRLRGLVTALPELARIRRIVISSEVGWKKPAAGFFAEVARAAEAPADQILIVGDDADNDFTGARAAGLHALLFDPHGRSALAPEWRIARLSDLVD